MKKLDKLIISSFIGPFILTFLVVVFILLMQHMLRYFDDIIGKDLGFEVISQLLFYFAIFMIPVAMPLAVLLSSLITFGNLGEHFELTAIKSSGISLLRTLQPIFIFVLFLTLIAFYVNNNLVPKAALEAYSLLYDIKQKKPALELREGTFYNGLPDISIKVDQKFPEDEAALKKVIVYDHRSNDGNKDVYVADSGRMYTILDERYLKFELYNGYNYSEGASDSELTGQKKQKRKEAAETLRRTKYGKLEMVFDLSSFDLQKTDKKWFQGNRIMRNLGELDHDIDSIQGQVLQQRLNHYAASATFFTYLKSLDGFYMPEEVRNYKLMRDSIASSKYEKYDSLKKANPDKNNTSKRKTRSRSIKKKDIKITEPTLATANVLSDSLLAIAKLDSAKRYAAIDSIFSKSPAVQIVQNATNNARSAKTQITNNYAGVETYQKELWIFEIQWHGIIARAMACIAMFLIGAPLGAIIKKGGLGVPFLVSIFFFIVYYLLTMQGEKLAKQGAISPAIGVWAADIILLMVGLVFLKQARADARLFEADFYSVVLDRFKRWFKKRKAVPANAVS